MMNSYTQMYTQQGFDMMLVEQHQQQYVQPEYVQAQKQERLGVKELTKKESVAERSTRRKQATQREKRRMEKLNHCIEDIKQIVCPDMKAPTKAKILREAINRIEYLERITQQMLDKFGGNIDQALPGFKEQVAEQVAEQGQEKKQFEASPASSSTYYSTSPASANSDHLVSDHVQYPAYNSPAQVALPSVASIANKSAEGEISLNYQSEEQYQYTIPESQFKLEPAFYQEQPSTTYY